MQEYMYFCDKCGFSEVAKLTDVLVYQCFLRFFAHFYNLDPILPISSSYHLRYKSVQPFKVVQISFLTHYSMIFKYL